MKKTIENAVFLAASYHSEQLYGGQPYEVHLKAVHDVLVEFGVTDQDLLIAAWLHGMLEDTNYPVREMAATFGPRITNLVWAVSGFGANRKERAADAYPKIQGTPGAALLKCADRIANIRASKGGSLEQMYLKDWRLFRDAIARLAPDTMYDELVRLHTVNS